jgi:hypothetical protein
MLILNNNNRKNLINEKIMDFLHHCAVQPIGEHVGWWYQLVGLSSGGGMTHLVQAGGGGV